MPSIAEYEAREDAERFEGAWLARFMARRADVLNTRAKRLAFARRQLAEHRAARDKWFASRQYYPRDRNSNGSFRCTNRRDWQVREKAWRRVIEELSELCGETVA